MMKRIFLYFCLTTAFLISVSELFATNHPKLHYFPADSKELVYVGRFQKNNQLYRAWSPGVYMKATFTGTTCYIILHDQHLAGVMYNYIEIVVDNTCRRIKLNSGCDTLLVSDRLSPGKHELLICKDTESGIGYLDFAGLLCENLLAVDQQSKYLIEFFGDSITCGASSDLSGIPCGAGRWEDQHNAYLSYGPRLARALNSDWIISAVSGIGLIHSCCGLSILLPEVYDKTSMKEDSLMWDFNKYRPDLVTICIGQNDGIQDSVSFCNQYIRFIQKLRQNYTNTKIILLSSPMADKKLTVVLQKYLKAIKLGAIRSGQKNVYLYFFKKQYHLGCDSHPDVNEHRLISKELLTFIQNNHLLNS